MFKKQSLSRRIYQSILAFVITIIALISVFAGASVYQNSRELYMEVCNHVLEQPVIQLDDLMNVMRTMPVTIGRDVRVQNAIRAKDYTALEERKLEGDVTTYLLEMNLYDESIFNIIFFSANGISAQSKYYRLFEGDITEKREYREAVQGVFFFIFMNIKY